MKQKDIWCSMCYSPYSDHEGGLEYKDNVIEGQFCSKKCFDLWVRWKVAFLEWSKL